MISSGQALRDVGRRAREPLHNVVQPDRPDEVRWLLSGCLSRLAISRIGGVAVSFRSRPGKPSRTGADLTFSTTASGNTI